MDTTRDYLSREKFAELEAELDDLRRNKRKEIAEQLESAKALGDLSENAEYHAAREAQAAIEGRISDIENTLKTAIITTKKHETTIVGIGSTVSFRRGKETKSFTLVGSEEADVAAGKISNRSPLGEALFGRKKGEKFSYMTPRGEEQCEILEIQ